MQRVDGEGMAEWCASGAIAAPVSSVPFENMAAAPGFASSRRGLLLGALAAAVASGIPLRQAAAQQGISWPRVQSLINNAVESGQVSGAVAALGFGQQPPQIVAAGKDHLLGDRLSDGDSLYRIYSMTKPITGMAAMLLVDEGKITLDQPISDFLPAFTNMQVQIQYDGALTPDNLEPATRPITLRHLLTHTAGLGYGFIQQGALAEAYRERGVVPGAVSWVEEVSAFRGTPAPSLAEFADRLAALPLVYQPGNRYSYSVGLDLVGRLIEVVSGESFDSFLQRRLLDPCGMTSTWFQVPQSELYRFTANYLVVSGTLMPIDLPDNSVYAVKQPFPYGGAGLVSTARDYDRFLQMLAGYGVIDGRRVMPEAAVRMGTSDLFPQGLEPVPMFPSTYGYGAGGRVGKGAAEGIFGWQGAAGTCGYVNMKTGLRHAFFTQYMPASAYSLPGDFTEAVAHDVGQMRLR